MMSLFAYYIGIGLVFIGIGLVLIVVSPKRGGKARCHSIITFDGEFTVYCHMPANHKGDCAAPLSQFVQAGYHKAPF